VEKLVATAGVNADSKDEGGRNCEFWKYLSQNHGAVWEKSWRKHWAERVPHLSTCGRALLLKCHPLTLTSKPIVGYSCCDL
jgi:hypothetical protein